LKTFWSYIPILFLIFLPLSIKAQTIDIQIDVNPEVDTRVIQPLDFGQLMAGTGVHQIQLGSPDMGIFHVRALRTQRFFLNLTADEALVHQNPEVEDSIPIELFASYTNFGIDDYRQSIPMGSLFEEVVVEETPGNPESAWSGLYIYIYGNIELGNVQPGLYTGEIVLTVIYE